MPYSQMLEDRKIFTELKIGFKRMKSITAIVTGLMYLADFRKVKGC